MIDVVPVHAVLEVDAVPGDHIIELSHLKPNGQLEHIDEPAGAHWPYGQMLGVEVGSTQKCPSGQVVHVVLPGRLY